MSLPPVVDIDPTAVSARRLTQHVLTGTMGSVFPEGSDNAGMLVRWTMLTSGHPFALMEVSPATR